MMILKMWTPEMYLAELKKFKIASSSLKLSGPKFVHMTGAKQDFGIVLKV